MRLRVVWRVAVTSFREFWRTPEAVFWSYAFPVVMAVVLGLAFSHGTPEPVSVVVQEGENAARLAAVLEQSPRLEVEVLPAEAADRALVRGNAAVVVSGAVEDPTLRLDFSRQEAELARMLVEAALQESAGRRDPLRVVVQGEGRPGSRYIDFLVPGLIGLDLLGAGMWGVGFTLVNMRQRHMLRRLVVTPMRRGEFLLGFLFSRIVLMFPEALAIVGFGALFFGVPMRGSWLALLLLVLVGGLAFTGLGLLVACRPRTVEGVSGLMNLVLIPMWLLGGSFFSNESFEGALHVAARIMPLTHVNDALRDVMLGGEGLTACLPALGGSLAFAGLCIALSIRLFRWTAAP